MNAETQQLIDLYARLDAEPLDPPPIPAAPRPVLAAAWTVLLSASAALSYCAFCGLRALWLWLR